MKVYTVQSKWGSYGPMEVVETDVENGTSRTVCECEDKSDAKRIMNLLMTNGDTE